MIKTRHILIGAGTLAAIVGAGYLLKVKRLSSEMESETKISIHRVSLTGIDMKIDVLIKNPSGGSIEVKHPFVKMIYGDKTIASSQIRNVNIKVPKFGEVKLEPIMITLKFFTLATTVPQLLKEYREQGKLNVTIKTITTINDSVPYSKTDNITLGNGKRA